MWRVVITALILSAGCAGRHEKRAADDAWIFGPSAREPQHPKNHDSNDVGSSICAGLFQILFGGDDDD